MNSVLRDVTLHKRCVDKFPPGSLEQYSEYFLFNEEEDGKAFFYQATGWIVSDPKFRFKSGEFVTTSILKEAHDEHLVTLNTIYDVVNYLPDEGV